MGRKLVLLKVVLGSMQILLGTRFSLMQAQHEAISDGNGGLSAGVHGRAVSTQLYHTHTHL